MTFLGYVLGYVLIGGKSMSLSDLKIRKAKVGVCSYKLFDGGGLYLNIMPT
ncbi:MAG: hypothetical protein JWO06_3467, partial [Bacteroidota bacterium]|nr:hypothetical protein [Bacteroidota bacterium]